MRVLVVEDDVDACDADASALIDAGHEVRTAFNLPSARTIALAFEPEVVLIDIGLPVFDGNEVASELRLTLERTPLMIAVTGSPQRAEERLFDAIVPKPIFGGALARILAPRLQT